MECIMNDRQKLNYIKKHLTGLKYLNSLLKDAISYHEEVGDGDYQFVYLNKIMENKFEKILKIL